MTKDFYTAIKDRRSIYGISKETPISDDRLKEIITHAVKYAPTAFNSQSGRVIALLGEHHRTLWDMTTEVLKKVVPADSFASTDEKIKSFRAGYGTLLYFEDSAVITSLQQQFPLYKDNFPIWSHQASGMLQFIIWTALESEGLGASLQHYNPLIDDVVRAEWKVPYNWNLIAQMPFGTPTLPPGEKSFQPLEERIKFFK